MSNPRRKGSKAERNVAHLLTDWVGTEFVRVPRSGGLRWSSGLMVTGDVIPADPRVLADFKFSVEVKFHAEVDFSHLLLGNKNVDILKFWDQVERDAKTVKKHPLLLFRYNFLPKDFYFAVVSLTVYSKIQSKIDLKKGCMKYLSNDYNFVILTSEDLFSVDYPIIANRL